MIGRNEMMKKQSNKTLVMEEGSSLLFNMDSLNRCKVLRSFSWYSNPYDIVSQTVSTIKLIYGASSTPILGWDPSSNQAKGLTGTSRTHPAILGHEFLLEPWTIRI